MSIALRLFRRIAFRNTEAYVLKVAALGIALATAIAITLFSINEFGHDRFHKNPDQVFRVIQKNLNPNYVGNRLSSKIDNGFIKAVKTAGNDSLIFSRVKILNRVDMSVNGADLFDQRIHAVDTIIDRIFSLDIVNGDLAMFKTYNNGSLLVSSEFAEEQWGKTDIAGERIKLYTFNDTLNISIAAVFKSFPRNSHERFDLLMSFNTENIARLSFNPDETGIFCITSLIFLLALTTFINLTSITLPYRSKELAVKKLFGTTRESLIIGFAKESFTLVGLSLAISVVILVSADPLIKRILGFSTAQMLINPDPTFIVTVAVLFLTLMISPLFMTIRFVNATPNRLLSTDTITFPVMKRNITFVQLGISIFLIIASVVVNRQINYSLVKEPGQNHDQIVYLHSPAGITNEGVANLRDGWRKYNPNILDVMAVSQLPDRVSSKEVNTPFYQMSVDLGYRDFFNLSMIEGYWFGPNSDDSAIVINQMAKNRLPESHEPILGVITDVNGLFNQAQRPTKLNLGNDYGYYWLCVRVLEVDIRRTIRRLTEQFSTSSERAEVRYLNAQFGTWIEYQDRLNKLSAVLAMIAAILSCCTIYALSMSVVRDKLKLIALHKLFGATTLNITTLLLTDFLRQLSIAIVIFLPISYLLLNELLRTFIYSTSFSWLDPIYPIAYCIVVIAAICALQAWHLKRTNSTASLKG